MKPLAPLCLLTLLLLSTFASIAAHDSDLTHARRSADVERGRYLVRIAGCNDCHTAEYAARHGAVDEKDWLTGSQLAFEGPWGTTYPSNLRLLVNELTREQWLRHARQPMRPPMPWFSLRDMTDEDLTAIYRYIRALGPAGAPAPAFEPPRKASKDVVITRWHLE